MSGAEYRRFTVTDHLRPKDGVLDGFVAFVQALPEGVHLHFHCHGGDGRTTSFMTFYDMMRNAGRVSLEAILERNRLHSKYCLCRVQADFHHDFGLERWALLAEFYEFSRDAAQAESSYSAWRRHRNVP